MCSLADPCVIAHDLRRGIPFADESFEVVYHSHVLEHLSQVEAHRFLCECCRVLTPGGTMRVVVPDLEEIARLYLRALELARQGDRGWQDNYDWMMIELYDQTIREVSGGGHGAYLNRPVIPNRAFVLMRHGREAAESIAGQERARARRRDAGVRRRRPPGAAPPIHEDAPARCPETSAAHLLAAALVRPP